ncbi:MAG: hypothetical protein ACI8WB_003286 [Phenylobacterium sp.]|jgi:hypothetical protein
MKLFGFDVSGTAAALAQLEYNTKKNNISILTMESENLKVHDVPLA